MALLSFLRQDTSSLNAQGGQRRNAYFNILRDIPCSRNWQDSHDAEIKNTVDPKHVLQENGGIARQSYLYL
jgi:hypothetical protein